jgi:RNA polymerase sigma-70 factor (ECF subfamily)
VDAPPFRVDDLDRHGDFLRRLARSLLRDGPEADDAVQETYLAALRRPPRDPGSPRAWLGAVLRNVVRKGRRAAQRRDARERHAATGRAAPSAGDLVARAEAIRAIGEAVRSLDPASREVVLLRHYEDLPPRAIAARLGVPAETVKSRLRRAHERLRERLDERGGRDAWTSPLAALVGLEPRAAAPGAAAVGVGAIAMGVSGKVVAATAVAVAALVGVGWAVRGGGEGARGRRRDAPPEPAAPVLSARAPDPVAERAAERPAVESRAPGRPVAAVREATGEEITAVTHLLTPVDVLEVVFLGPGSLDGVSVVLSPQAIDSPHAARVGHPTREGVVRLSGVPAGSWWLDLRGPGPVQRRRDLVVPWRPDGNYRQVLATGTAAVRGRLFDRGGSPLPDRRVALHAQGDWATYVAFAGAETRTDADGRYAFGALHSGRYLLNAALYPGDPDRDGDHRTETLDLAPGEDRELDLGEQRPEPLWRGRVRLASGTPFRGGSTGYPSDGTPAFDLVRPGSEVATTTVPIDADGRVAHRVPRGTWRLRLVVPAFETELVVGDADLERDVVLPGVRVRGVARDARTRGPVEGGLEAVRIERADPALRSGAGGMRGRVAPDGGFSFDGVLPGRWRVGATAHHRPGRPSAWVEIDVPDARDVDGVVLDLSAE